SEQADQGPQGPGRVRHPLYIKVHGRNGAGAPLVTNAVPTGYTPAQIRTYLGLVGDGAGQTIAIVDAFDHPTIASDLNAYSAQFGLPLICGSPGATSDCFVFEKQTPQGTPQVSAGWALEIALDVEWAHAVAPHAKIILVESLNNYLLYGNTGLLPAIDYAAQRPGVVVISNSWGGGEFSSEAFYDGHCALATAVCTFASGDGGNPGLWLGYNPYVVSVGGTTLSLSPNGALLGETAWNGSGGGISKYESRPAYQTVN